MYEDSWFQLEGAPWRPLRHPVDAVRHAFNYVQYKITRAQVSMSCIISVVQASGCGISYCWRYK